MKTVVRVTFSSSRFPGGVQAALGRARCGPDVTEFNAEPLFPTIMDVTITLEETDPRLPGLFRLLKQLDSPWMEIRKDVFTEEELDSARLLLMQPTYQTEGRRHAVYSMIYDLSGACAACGIGGKQTSAVFVSADDLWLLEGQRAGSITFSYILLNAELEEELSRSGATGISLRDVYAVWNDKQTLKLPFRQLSAARMLPPMSPSTTGLIRAQPCKACSQNGYFETDNEPTRIVYRASDLREADDVNISCENIGYGALIVEVQESLPSCPRLMVTPKVRRVFTDAGVTCFDWIPVRVEEGSPS